MPGPEGVSLVPSEVRMASYVAEVNTFDGRIGLRIDKTPSLASSSVTCHGRFPAVDHSGSLGNVHCSKES